MRSYAGYQMSVDDYVVPWGAETFGISGRPAGRSVQGSHHLPQRIR